MNWYKKVKDFGKGVAIPLGVGALLAPTLLPNSPHLNQEYVQTQQNTEEQKPDKSNYSEINTPVNSNIEDSLMKHEGYSPKLYRDTMGIPTIGFGFNLTRQDARTKIESLGLNYDAVLNGTQLINKSQATSLLKEDIINAQSQLLHVLPSVKNQPQEVKNILTDMIFNMGVNKFLKFHSLINAINHRNYPAAAQAMKESKWFKEVGHRGTELVNRMLSIR